MIRKLLLSFFVLLSITTLNAQSISITGSTTGGSGSSPNALVGSSTYHVVEAIYLDAEIGSGNFIGTNNAITRVEFAANNTGTATFPITIPGYSIYMKNIPSTTTIFTAGTYSLTDYTLVYTGSLTFTSAGAQYAFSFAGGVDLATPFARTVGTNLQVLIIRNSGSAVSGTVAIDCANGNSVAGSATAVTSSRRYNGTAVPVEGTTSLTVSNFRPAIKLIRPLGNDAGLVSFTTRPTVSTCFNTPQTIAVSLSNSGTNAIASGAVPVTIAITGANTYTTTISNTGSINPGGSETITFSGINLGSTGLNTVTVYSTLPGDLSTINDTLRTTINTAPSYNTYPVNAGAEASSPLVFQYLTVLTGTNHWNLNGSVTSSATGAYKNADLTDSIFPRNGTGYFLFDSYSGASSLGHRGVIYAGCFNFNSPANISFWMSQDNSFNTDLDSVYVVVSTDRGATWTRVSGFGRVNSNFPTPGWDQKSVNIAAYANQTVQIGFEGVSKYGNVIAIDDIEITAANSLPVSLGEFTGIRENDKNILKWHTLTEANNAGFTIERSIDGRSFSSVGVVSSLGNEGNSNSLLRYRFIDEKPLVGINYYRLKQTDKDGKFNYSDVVAIKVSKSGLSITSIYPNPIKDKFNISLTSETTEAAKLIITDVFGKTLIQKNIQVATGVNTVNENITQFSSGVYMLKIITAKGQVTEPVRIVKQ